MTNYDINEDLDKTGTNWNKNLSTTFVTNFCDEEYENSVINFIKNVGWFDFIEYR